MALFFQEGICPFESADAEEDGQKREKNGAYGLERERDRMVRGPNGLVRKRKQLQRVLAECRNTFKDVFDRIDSELGLVNPNLGRVESRLG